MVIEQFLTNVFITCLIFYLVGLGSGYFIGYLTAKYLGKDEKIPRWDRKTNSWFNGLAPLSDSCVPKEELHASCPEDPFPYIRKVEEEELGIPTGRIKHPTAQQLRERKKSKKEREADKAMEESLKESGL